MRKEAEMTEEHHPRSFDSLNLKWLLLPLSKWSSSNLLYIALHVPSLPFEDSYKQWSLYISAMLLNFSCTAESLTNLDTCSGPNKWAKFMWKERGIYIPHLRTKPFQLTSPFVNSPVYEGKTWCCRRGTLNPPFTLYNFLQSNSNYRITQITLETQWFQLLLFLDLMYSMVLGI